MRSDFSFKLHNNDMRSHPNALTFSPLSGLDAFSTPQRNLKKGVEWFNTVRTYSMYRDERFRAAIKKLRELNDSTVASKVKFYPRRGVLAADLEKPEI